MSGDIDLEKIINYLSSLYVNQEVEFQQLNSNERSLVNDIKVVIKKHTERKTSLRNNDSGIGLNSSSSNSTYSENNSDEQFYVGIEEEDDDEDEYLTDNEEGEEFSNNNNVDDDYYDEDEDDEDEEDEPATKKRRLDDKENTEKDIPLYLKKKAVEYWRGSNTKKCRKFSSVKTQFRFVKDRESLYRYERQIKNHNRIQKSRTLYQEVKKLYDDAKAKGLIIHDSTVRLWALISNKKVKLPKFKASRRWVLKFKKKFRIVSRKINKYYTKKQKIEEEEKLKKLQLYREIVKKLIAKYGKRKIFNSDQSGINREKHSGRTLADKGEKTIECSAQSIFNMTHSGTIMPVISAAGDLALKLFTVLQEAGGKFGPLVTKRLPKECTNLIITCSQSGKMSNELMKDYYTDLLLPTAAEQTGKKAILLDSWGGHGNKDNLTEAAEKVNFKIKDLECVTIPAGCTGKGQPLDVYYFRPFKNFLTRLSDDALDPDYEVNMKDRIYFCKSLSLVHFQFCAPRFKNLIKYAWIKSLMTDDEKPSFKTPVQYCFDINLDQCMIKNCKKDRYVRCAWCEKEICFSHFYHTHHICVEI